MRAVEDGKLTNSGFWVMLHLRVLVYIFWFDVMIGFLRSVVGNLMAAAKFVPGVQGALDEENRKMLEVATKHFKLAGDDHVYGAIPEKALSESELVAYLTQWASKEHPGWRDGKVSGKVYNGDPAIISVMKAVYELYCVSNALHPEVFPSIRKFEAETIRMTASMLHGDANSCGTLTSGGTESILMAMKTYREYARKGRGIQHPEVIMSEGAHAAFDKAQEYFGIKVIRMPTNPDGTTNLASIEAKINSNTIGIVGSTPNYAHGSIDDIEAMAEIALRHNILLHVDACLGGFFLPWAQKILGNEVIKPFDFAVKGVSSISCDTHKYGFGPKGESVLLFSSKDIRRYMYFVAPDWNGGIYASPTVSGSRPGAPIAGTWAVMVATGEEGYMKATQGILETRKVIVDGLADVPEIELISDHASPVIAWRSATSTFDIFMVLDAMKRKKWVLDPLQFPNAIHICLTVRHIGKGQEFVNDFKEAVQLIKADSTQFIGGMAPVYGLAAAIPDRSVVRGFVTGYLDSLLDITGAADPAPVASSSSAPQ